MVQLRVSVHASCLSDTLHCLSCACLPAYHAGPPRILLYDNACHQWAYSFARAPTNFWWCRMYVDKLHWFNHVYCSSVFDIRIDDRTAPRGINTQVLQLLALLTCAVCSAWNRLLTAVAC